MIVSHLHRFIFFAVPRTATHSVRQALRVHLGEDDWEQQARFDRSLSSISEIASIGHGHISAREIRPHLTDENWRDYFKFAIVRNPFERFISVCAFLNRDNPEFEKMPLDWMKAAMHRPRFQNRVLVRPQFELLCNEQGELAVDFTGRYENLQTSMAEIFSRTGLPTVDLEHQNAAEHTHYRDYYDDELLSLVERYYADDLQLFEYEF